MMWWIVLASFVSVWLSAASVGAQGPPIRTETAFVVGLDGAAVRTFLQTTRKTKLLRDGEEIPDVLEREATIMAVPVVVPYELISNRLVVGAGIPFLDKELKLIQNGIRRTLATRGFGDLSLFGKVQLFQRDRRKKTTRITVKGTVKLPTGDHTQTDEAGVLLPRSLQLGTGTVDVSVGMILTHIVGRAGLNADVIYGSKGETDGFAFGDALIYDIAFGYRVFPGVYKIYPSPYATVYLELNGRRMAKSRSDGRDVVDSGGHTLFLSPGFQYIPRGNLILEASLQIPVRQQLGGTQLGTDYVFRGGVRWLIF